MLARAQALESLTLAVLHTEHRKAAFGRGKQPEQYGAGGGAPRPDMMAAVKARTAPSGLAWARACGIWGDSGD